MKTCPPKDFIRIFIASLLQIALNQKQPKYPSTANYINKLWYIHTTEHKMLNAMTWRSSEHITLSERDQTKKEYTLYDLI